MGTVGVGNRGNGKEGETDHNTLLMESLVANRQYPQHYLFSRLKRSITLGCKFTEAPEVEYESFQYAPLTLSNVP